jgi:hypothetical protein
MVAPSPDVDTFTPPPAVVAAYLPRERDGLGSAQPKKKSPKKP